MAQGEFYKVSLEFTQTDSGKLYFPGFYVEQTSVPGFDVTDVGAVVKDWWDQAGVAGAAQKTWHAANYELTSVRLRKWDPLEPVETSYTAGLPIAGTATGASYAPNNAILVSLRTSFIGRSYRNRVYLPSPAEGVVQNGIFADADALSIADRFTEMIGDLSNIGAGGLSSATVSAYSKLLSTGNDVIQVLVDENLRSQRRRTPRAAIYHSP